MVGQGRQAQGDPAWALHLGSWQRRPTGDTGEEGAGQMHLLQQPLPEEAPQSASSGKPAQPADTRYQSFRDFPGTVHPIPGSSRVRASAENGHRLWVLLQPGLAWQPA